VKAKIEEPRRRPKRNKLSYKNRWLISRHLVMHLQRAGVVCDIIVPENIELPPDGVMSPGERVALALVTAGVDAEHPAIEDEQEIVSAIREIKRLH
jgi:hypothetical protein